MGFSSRKIFRPAAFAGLLFASFLSLTGPSRAAQPAVSQRLEPSTIGMGQAAQLTIAASGASASSAMPPAVDGLDFIAVGQSNRVEWINGVTTATTSVTYRVIPRRTGVFSIPSQTPGSPPLVLTVQNAGAPNGSQPGGGASAGTGANSSAGANPQSAAPSAGGSAFVRLNLSKHELYVGERIPIDIQVGTRDGLVVSIDGLPTLKGDAFTLDGLASQPQRTQEVIDGQPFTVFTWHSALSAVKPGELALTMETPLTVRLADPPRQMRMFADGSMEDFVNDPNMQSFFGGASQKQVNVASPATAFNVLPLPTADRPADFSGAVGSFEIKSDLSDDKVTAGDPVTLHLRVSGSGNFDRVNSRMLHDVEHFKTYSPKGTFAAADEVGYRGEKTFDQPVIATQPGAQSLPALTFSWFDPTTRRYTVAHTSPLPLDVAAATHVTAQNTTSDEPSGAGGTAAASVSPAAARGPLAGLHADRPDNADPRATLVPRYYESTYLLASSALLIAFVGSGFWIRRRDVRVGKVRAARERVAALRVEPMLMRMDEAATAGNPEVFLQSARMAVQRVLGSKWHLPPDTIELDDIVARLGPQPDVARLFMLADEATYARVQLSALEYQSWREWVTAQIRALGD